MYKNGRCIGQEFGQMDIRICTNLLSDLETLASTPGTQVPGLIQTPTQSSVNGQTESDGTVAYNQGLSLYG